MSCGIYGRERLELTWNVNDPNNATIADTLDWVMTDKLLDGTDNTKELTNKGNYDVQDMIYESKGNKDITATVDFDDGWGTVFQHETKITVEAKVYEEPILEFTWNPEEPTVLDEVTFTQNHDDIRDDKIHKAYGRIDSVDVDYLKDGELDEEDRKGIDEFKHIFPIKKDGTEIQLLIKYWDGWETQNTEITKLMNMTNIPPETSYNREDTGRCVPNYIWTATSTDVDDAEDELSYKWTLYQKNDNNGWEELDSGNKKEYTYAFQEEDSYKLVLRTTDDEGDWTEKEEEFDILFDSCDSGSNGKARRIGTITLQPNRFQDIAIPVKGVKVKEYFLDTIAETIGSDVSDVIELVKAFPSSDTSRNKYLIYKPGVSEPEDEGNFELVQTDGNYTEITAFRVKTKEFDGTIEFNWDTEDGEE